MVPPVHVPVSTAEGWLRGSRSVASASRAIAGRLYHVQIVPTVRLYFVDARFAVQIREVLAAESEAVPEDGVADPIGLRNREISRMLVVRAQGAIGEVVRDAVVTGVDALVTLGVVGAARPVRAPNSVAVPIRARTDIVEQNRPVLILEGRLVAVHLLLRDVL